MEQRLHFLGAAPDIMKQVLALNEAVEACGLERSLLHIVKLRASQINGCSYCVDMHSREARQVGESEQRVHLVAAWRESPLYSPRERAALAWTETLTALAGNHVEDAAFDAAREHFSEEEMVKLSVVIGMINVWNRLCTGFRAVHPAAAAQAA